MNSSSTLLAASGSSHSRCRLQRLAALALAAVTFSQAAYSQTLLYKEDFNTNGEGSRYSTEGGGVVPGLETTGPAYWARNVDVLAIGKVVGVPAPAPAKRAILVYHHNLPSTTLTPEALKLIDATIKWLTDGKAKLKILFSAAANVGEGDQFLVQRLTEQGHTVVDDEAGTQQNPDGLPDPKTIDLVINGSSAGEPQRLIRYAVPILSYRASISGDMLLATRGETGLNFDPGEVSITAPNHPIAAGLPTKFTYVTETQTLDTVGLGLPAAATTIATYKYTNDQGVTSTRPLLVVFDKDAQLLGGLITGFDGAFWTGADLNEPTLSNGTFGTPSEPRTLTLKPINVAGKPNVKLTLAMAGTDVDFDFGADDFFRIMIDTDGNGPSEFTALATFASPSGSDKFYTDGKTRLGIVAKDVTYDIPASATELVIRFESNSTFWNEIVAIDDIRVTSGEIVTKPLKLAFSRTGADITLTWEGAATLETSGTVNTGWTAVAGAASGYKVQTTGAAAFYRLRAR
ncbi:MAG: hypothetical protein HY735_23350 [Verrucomicrobia bacterium]|nr:hypothetical protein [Verrucomicrobiota bacterium]